MTTQRGPGNWPVDPQKAFLECHEKLDKARRDADHWRDNHKSLRAEVERQRLELDKLRKLVGPEEEDPLMETPQGYVPLTRHQAVQLALFYKTKVERLEAENEKLRGFKAGDGGGP